jgi:hypothetical protein
MDNNSMITEVDKTVETTTNSVRKPDESPGLNIEAKIKIWNPETGEVMLEGRG